MSEKGGYSGPKNPSNPMTKEAASRIQSAGQEGGTTQKGTFESRTQSAADKNEHHGYTKK